jgi:hypothetical protein
MHIDKQQMTSISWVEGMRSTRQVLMILLGLFGCWQTCQAADFACNTTGDTGVACLIAAINAANANGEANTITLTAGTYTLTAPDNPANGLPVITSSLTIRGAEVATTIIERAATAPAFRFLHVAPTGTLTLQGLTLRGGGTFPFSSGSFNGGGILNNGGQVTLSHSVLASNIVTNGSGAGLYSTQGIVILDSSTLAENMGGSPNGVQGGGLAMVGGTLTIVNSTIAGNEAAGPGSSGGGVYASGALVEIVNSTITGNRANGHFFAPGGGLALAGGTLTITNSTIADNVSIAIVPSGGGLTMSRGTLTITNSMITGNHGGGLETSGGTITNSTIAGNSARTTGGPSVSGGITAGGPVSLQNTILANNSSAETMGPDCQGPVTSLDYNLIGDPSGCAITLQQHDLTGPPGLDAFTDNGMPGNGHFPLLSTSQAINAGNDAACPLTDQLGQPRAGRCDIGAIEFQPTNRCPLGQGFWKNHTGAWPVTSLTLGRQTYTQAELLALFDTPPRGDASVILAQQLIAAKLNIANGSNSNW